MSQHDEGERLVRRIIVIVGAVGGVGGLLYLLHGPPVYTITELNFRRSHTMETDTAFAVEGRVSAHNDRGIELTDGQYHVDVVFTDDFYRRPAKDAHCRIIGKIADRHGLNVTIRPIEIDCQ